MTLLVLPIHLYFLLISLSCTCMCKLSIHQVDTNYIVKFATNSNIEFTQPHLLPSVFPFIWYIQQLLGLPIHLYFLLMSLSFVHACVWYPSSRHEDTNDVVRHEDTNDTVKCATKLTME